MPRFKIGDKVKVTTPRLEQCGDCDTNNNGNCLFYGEVGTLSDIFPNGTVYIKDFPKKDGSTNCTGFREEDLDFDKINWKKRIENGR